MGGVWRGYYKAVSDHFHMLSWGIFPTKIVSTRLKTIESGTPLKVVMSELAKGCSHFNDFKKMHGLQSYRIIYQYLVKPTPEARKLKVSHIRYSRGRG